MTRKQLKLSPFTLSDICKAISHCRRGDSLSHLLEDLHISFLKFIAKERRAMDGKINFHNHTLFMDNSHLVIPAFVPEAMPQDLEPFEGENDPDTDFSEEVESEYEEEDVIENFKPEELCVKVQRATAAASKEAIARIIGLSSSEDNGEDHMDVSDYEELETVQPASTPDIPPFESENNTGLGSRPQSLIYEELEVSSRRKSGRSKESKAAITQKQKLNSKGSRRSDRTHNLHEVALEDVSESTSVPEVSNGNNNFNIVNGAWFINHANTSNWCYLLMMCLREVNTIFKYFFSKNVSSVCQ